MSFEFMVGDKIITDKEDYYITGKTKEGQSVVTWVEDNGVPASVLYTGLTPDRIWIERVERNGEVVYPEHQFEFGDEVRNKISPAVKAIFLDYNDDGKTAKVAYRSTNGRASVEASNLVDLRPA